MSFCCRMRFEREFSIGLRFSIGKCCLYRTCCSTDKGDISLRNCSSRAALKYVLTHSDTLDALVKVSQRQYSEENVMCWLAIRDYKGAVGCRSSHDVIREQAQEIVRQVRVC